MRWSCANLEEKQELRGATSAGAERPAEGMWHNVIRKGLDLSRDREADILDPRRLGATVCNGLIALVPAQTHRFVAALSGAHRERAGAATNFKHALSRGAVSGQLPAQKMPAVQRFRIAVNECRQTAVSKYRSNRFVL